MSAAANKWVAEPGTQILSRSPEPRVRLEVRTVSDWPRTVEVWSELAAACPECSFFLDRTWVEAWLATFGDHLNPSILVFESDSLPVGICLLVRTFVVRGFIPLRGFSLNTTGEAAQDTCYAEYNTVLCRPGYEEPVTAALARHLKELSWDELTLSAFTMGDAYQSLQQAFGRLDREEQVHSSYFVSLSELRDRGVSFQEALGSKQRKHLRQNLRHYGSLELEIARDLGSSVAFLEEMAELSRKRWEAAGRTTMFASQRFSQFHRELVERGFPTGEVQLMRVRSGSETVGVVCNLVHRGKVYFYQCGYNYGNDPRRSPGTVTLSLVIEHYLAEGFDQFDFLSGDAPYKRWLSTGSRTLSWLTLRRPGFRVAALQTLRSLRSSVRRTLAGRRSE